MATEAVRTGTSVVLDLSAIASLVKLDCVDVLRTLPTSLVVSQGILAELQDLLTEERATDPKSGILGKTETGYIIIEQSEEYQQAQIANLSSVIEVIKSTATILPCRELAAFDPERRQILYKAFGRYGAESIVLASAPGRVLWTDDFRQAGFATQEHGVRRIWTQAMLQLSLGRGSLSSDQYFEISAKLLGFRYLFTSSNPHILLAAGKLADWNVGQPPLDQALMDFKAEYIDTIAQVQFAASFLFRLYQEPISRERRDGVLVKILDNIALKPDGLQGIAAIQQAIPQLFKLNLVGAEQSSDCIRRWIQSRSIVTLGQ